MRKILIILFIACFSTSVIGQELSTIRRYSLLSSSDTLRIDSVSIVSDSFIISDKDGVPLSSDDYYLQSIKSLLFLKKEFKDSLYLQYRVFAYDLSQPFFHKDTAIIQEDLLREDPFRYKVASTNSLEIFEGSSLKRNGSISRGMVVGNKQNLSVNSDFNLQLSGKLSDKINILANISDSNIPIQAEGNTQQLQEFDNIFIKLFNDKSSLIAGDFRMDYSKGRFLRYAKKARGISYSFQDNIASSKDSLRQLSISTSMAVSKGKFSRNVFKGIEGNQGPYQLRGADNELFIIVLSGTESVYIDGALLDRGEDRDYVIDYNSSEITFTSNFLITKDKDIKVEFQYSDKNYSRSAVQVSAELKKRKSLWAFSFYNEQDSKNQPLQQDLSDEEKELLSQVGDQIDDAIIQSVDSVPFSNSEVLYLMIDSLGYDSVFVYGPSVDSTNYRVSFTFFGKNMGDYIQDGFTPNGRKYRWIAPDTIGGEILRRGEYRPVKRLVNPQKRQVISVRHETYLNKGEVLYVEASMSNRDVNTFSSKGDDDNVGIAINAGVVKSFRLSKKLKLQLNLDHEWKGKQFDEIERYRTVEFDDDWNFLSSGSVLDQNLSKGIVSLIRDKDRSVSWEVKSFLNGDDYSGLRNRLSLNWKQGAYSIRSKASILESRSVDETRFVRHRMDLSREFAWFKIGLKDDIESNKFKAIDGDSLKLKSYEYFDAEVYISNKDTSKSMYRIYAKNRLDRRSNSHVLKDVNAAEEYGLRYKGKLSKLHYIDFTFAQRSLRIIDSLSNGFASKKPEDSFIAKVNYRGSAFKKGLVFSTFYDISSGLERRKEFIYIQVPTGQGVYVWVDYNENGVKELDEFEVAAFQYEADYIRSFTLTNSYQKTYANALSQSLEISPSRWFNEPKGLGAVLSKFSNSTYVSISRKTSREDQSTAVNPFIRDIDNESLISVNSSLRNILYFNKRSNKWGMDYTYLGLASKSLLSNGFEARDNSSHHVNLRWNITKELQFIQSVEDGIKISKADYSVTRNYEIEYNKYESMLKYQPGTNYRISIKAQYNEKENDNMESDNELARIQTYGVEGRYSKAGKGNVQLGFDFIQIDYNGSANNSLSFEMLEGLAKGTNLTWNVLVQQNIMKNLELGVNYNARKSKDQSIIHTGGMQLRAIF